MLIWTLIWWIFWYERFLNWFSIEIKAGRRPVPTKLSLFLGLLLAGLIPFLAVIMTIRDIREKL